MQATLFPKLPDLSKLSSSGENKSFVETVFHNFLFFQNDFSPVINATLSH